MIKFQDGIPIYLQIVKQIKGQMLSGKLTGSEKLPSVRELAEQYKVNPNTVQRVFMELDSQGLTYSERGIGTFVKADPTIMETLREEMAATLLVAFLDEMKNLGYSKEDINKLLAEEWSKKGDK